MPLAGNWKIEPATIRKLIEQGGYNSAVQHAVIILHPDGKFDAMKFPDCLRTLSTPFKSPNKILGDFHGGWRIEADSILFTYDYTEADGKIYQTSFRLKCHADLSRLSIELGEGEEEFVLVRSTATAVE